MQLLHLLVHIGLALNSTSVNWYCGITHIWYCGIALNWYCAIALTEIILLHSDGIVVLHSTGIVALHSVGIILLQSINNQPLTWLIDIYIVSPNMSDIELEIWLYLCL